MGINYNTNIVRNGLVLHLDAANVKSYPGSGTTWFDISGNGNHGTLVDGPTFDANNNGSIGFDGLNDRIHVASLSDKFSWTPSGSGLNNLTIEFFVKTSDINDGQIISKPWNGNGEYNYRIGTTAFFTNIGNQSHNQSYTSFASSNWQHICAILTPTQKALYRNGNIYSAFTNHNITNNTPANGNINANLCMMSLYPYNSGWAGNTGFSIAGNLSCVRFYNRILTETEIKQNFESLRGRYGI